MRKLTANDLIINQEEIEKTSKLKGTQHIQHTPFIVECQFLENDIKFYFTSALRMKMFIRDFPSKANSMFYRLKPYITERALKQAYDTLLIENIIKTYGDIERTEQRIEIN